MASEYGVSLSTYQSPDGVADMDPRWRMVSGRQGIVESIARRFITPQGHYRKAPEYGYLLMQHLNGKMTPLRLARIKAQVESQIRLDERVRTVTVRVTSAPDTLRVAVSVTSADGPFSMVMEASVAAVKLIETVLQEAA